MISVVYVHVEGGGGNLAIEGNINGPWWHYPMWKKSDKEKYYMISLNLCNKRRQGHRNRGYNCVFQLVPRSLEKWDVGQMVWTLAMRWIKVKVKSLSHVQFSDPMDGNLPGSTVHGIFQARILEWAAIYNSGDFMYFMVSKVHNTLL